MYNVSLSSDSIFSICLSFHGVYCLCWGFRPSQPNGVMSSVVSLPNHTFTGQALSSKRLTSIVHILSPETDNCPSWISGRERMTVENISWSISTKECCLLVSSRTAHPTEPPRPASWCITLNNLQYSHQLCPLVHCHFCSKTVNWDKREKRLG